MSENIWEELARSPLDPDPDEQPASFAWLAPAAIAMVAGLLMGFFLGSGSSAAAPSTTIAVAEATTSTPAPPAPDPILPDGYTAVGTGGLRAVAAYSQGGNLYVVMDQTVRSDTAPLASNSLYFAKWTLTGDGIEVTASRSIASTVAPGAKVIEFPGVAALPIAGAELIGRQATTMVVRSGCNGCGATSADVASGEIVLDGLERPYSITEPLLIPIGDGITLSIDQLDIADDWGYATWHVIDENDAVVRVNLVVTFAGTDDPGREGANPTQLLPPQLFGVSQQRQTTPNPDPFARDGSVGLDRAGELLSAANQPTALLLEWSAEWQHPVGDVIVLPLAGLTDMGIID